MVTARLVIRNLEKIMIRLKRKIGVIHVEPTQTNTYFTTWKQLKTQGNTPLTFQLHKISKETNTYTTVLRNSANVS